MESYGEKLIILHLRFFDFRTPSNPWPLRRLNNTIDDGMPSIKVSASEHNELTKSFRSSQCEKSLYLRDSIRSWEACTNQKSIFSYGSPMIHRRSGASDPRFRKVVQNRTPKTSDVGTDTEDLNGDKIMLSNIDIGINTSKRKEDSKFKGNKADVITLSKAEKPDSVTNCGVQTMDSEKISSDAKTHMSKGLPIVQSTESDIFLGQYSCAVKKSRSDTSMKYSAVDGDCWTEKIQNKSLAPQEHPYEKTQVNQDQMKRYEAELGDIQWQSLEAKNKNEGSEICVPKGCPLVKEKCIDSELTSHREIKIPSMNKFSLKCKCNKYKKRLKDSFANITQKGSRHSGKDMCTHCMKESSEVLADYFRTIMMLVLGMVFVITSSMWLVSILIEFVPVINEWLYPPPEENVKSTMETLFDWLSDVCSSIANILYNLFF
ncbi:uncharacterized protein [Periplaneta americana]|uniref:uncharacterized protein isoform X2 n=1 Tax=Periplaneta americana TaxID=6978 RepID=UPI0037E8998B